LGGDVVLHLPRSDEEAYVPDVLSDRPRFSPADTPRSADPLITAQEVAQMLSVPASWVYAQTRLHRIPTVRLGRYYRYRWSAITEWITGLEAESPR
jgi:excisionase family DNA binding protein